MLKQQPAFKKTAHIIHQLILDKIEEANHAHKNNFINLHPIFDILFCSFQEIIRYYYFCDYENILENLHPNFLFPH